MRSIGYVAAGGSQKGWQSVDSPPATGEPPPHPGEACRHVPVKTGLRFSMKAARPSL
jgi:hypothetical protein